MLYLSEVNAAGLLTLDDAIDTVEASFAALSTNKATAFEVATAKGFDDRERWAVKTGRYDGHRTLGFKVGSNWPGNRQRGIPTHASTVVLMDPDTGYALAVIGASHLTVLRTAAADAVAVKHLARKSAATLAIVGAGHQALWDAKAISRVRTLADIRVTNRDMRRAEAMALNLMAEGLQARACVLEEALHGADIIVTATSATDPVLKSGMVENGAHISAMGADSPGKQELPVELLLKATLFCDVREQSVTIGEFQSLSSQSGFVAERITCLGDVITGKSSGRRSIDEITIFDSSGTAIQDLAVCSRALRLAEASGSVVNCRD